MIDPIKETPPPATVIVFGDALLFRNIQASIDAIRWETAAVTGPPPAEYF
jgi:hypothetical protein